MINVRHSSTLLFMGSHSKSEFQDEFCRRTKEAREGHADYTQEEIAALLGIDRDKYKQYEKRTPLPHYLVARFCLATKTSPDWLFQWKQPSAKPKPKETPPADTDGLRVPEHWTTKDFAPRSKKR